MYEEEGEETTSDTYVGTERTSEPDKLARLLCDLECQVAVISARGDQSTRLPDIVNEVVLL